MQRSGGGNTLRLARQRRAWNARAISLTFAALAGVTMILLCVLSNRRHLVDVILATGVSGMGNIFAYFIVRANKEVLGILLLIFSSLAQHVLIAFNPLAAVTIPFFASIFVMIGAVCLERKWLWLVACGAAVCIFAEWRIAVGLGLTAAELRGPYIAASVMLEATIVVAWLHMTGLENAVALGVEYEKERADFQERLQSAARMEALGRLAGGIAHDFNNLLVVMQGSAELAKDYLGKDHPALHELEQIEDAGARAESLTLQLLAYSRRQEVKKETVELAVMLANLEPLMCRLVGPEITTRLDVEQGSCRVNASTSQLEQVVLNLLANARDASEVGTTIVVALRRAPGFGVISVTDQGSGMSQETIKRVFEPFFTTKGDRGGTGLGLATSFALVEEMGGSIEIESELGRGSTFKVLLPLLGEQGQQRRI